MNEILQYIQSPNYTMNYDVCTESSFEIYEIDSRHVE